MQVAERSELGAIVVGESYPIHEFQRRAGMGRTSMRAARRNGLKVRKSGKKVFINGSDWIEYLEAANAQR